MKRWMLHTVLSISMLMNLPFTQKNYECYEVLSSETTAFLDIEFQSNERYPQTIIHDVVVNFLSKEECKKDKKVLVIGYDGFREDALQNVLHMENSAVATIKETGGLYHSYAGANGMQETSTAPGWLSILSGRWAYEVGVVDNLGVKPIATETFLSKAVDMGYAATFISSWEDHFTTTYRDDILSDVTNVSYVQKQSDEETIAEVNTLLKDESEEAYDVALAILEYSDHVGHTSGYGNTIESYKAISQIADQKTYDMIQQIQNRKTYDQEDWLIILTSDHGGYGVMHGGDSVQEVNTWFVMNKELKDYI